MWYHAPRTSPFPIQTERRATSLSQLMSGIFILFLQDGELNVG